MRVSGVLILFLSVFLVKLNAQTKQDQVLFTIDNKPVYTSEFLRVYNKNLDLVQDESQKEVDNYLELFINYKLKLKEAHALGFDTNPSYLRELSSYKKQLANSFMKETKVTDALVEEAYERISFDVNANHILVKLAETASPKDTLAAFNKISELRDRALKEGFEKVRQEVHNGQTVYGEKLGYFSGFKMVYDFETVAFNTPVGDISKPFRTRFGYHIVNVLDKRESRGERTVAHIMLVDNNNNTEKAEVKIQDIYQKLKQGEDFEALAKQFSDDKSTSSNGGKLAPIVGGQLRSQEFEDVAFSLENIGDFSQPFKSAYGWHIVKLYNAKPTPEFETIKPELINKVKRDDRSKLIDEALIAKLKKHYRIASTPDLSYFESILNDSYFTKTWFLPPSFIGKKNLVVIGKRSFSYKHFADYLMKSQRNPTAKASFKTIVNNVYNNFLNENLIRYHENNLEDENEEFANIVGEYRDGLLLFDLMENTIWNAASNDTLAVKEYFESHKANYISNEKIDAVVASSSNKKALKKVAKWFEKGYDVEKIKPLVNSEDKIEVLFSTGVLEKTHQTLPENLPFNVGVSKILSHNNSYVVVKIKEVLPKKQLEFVEAKGAVISDYQQQKEINWVNGLHEKYEVDIDEKVLQEVKNKIKNN
ncbi:peptidylprolyl isomerase [Tamlana sp. 62-3]|uniref:Peptidylprolyl isomerase n=1 Tax=Neotamlana sargassicola TaxID=2883125 RepID=A0A9X1L8W8_9FLAO|nr:peptidylprolyl isomerase [Tamlana sargassicola]MCB4809298.1 peptidylprolyl isomerase [Tamlana sargassicola]